MANDDVLIGQDVTVYVVTGGGLDGPNTGFNPGASYNMLGRWESIEVTFMRKMIDVTSSDSGKTMKRVGPSDWKATLSNLVRYVGSVAMTMGRANEYIQVQFTDGSGLSMVMIGGIESGTLTVNGEAEKDKIEVIGMGFDNDISYGGV